MGGHHDRFIVPAGQTGTVYAAWVIGPSHTFHNTKADESPTTRRAQA
jgi:hypothetical protein